MYYDTLKKRKELIEKHEVVVRLETNIRKMKELVEVSKRDKTLEAKHAEIANPESVLTGKEWDLDEMKKKVEAAKRKMTQEQNNVEKEARTQEDKLSDIDYQVKLLEVRFFIISQFTWTLAESQGEG